MAMARQYGSPADCSWLKTFKEEVTSTMLGYVRILRQRGLSDRPSIPVSIWSNTSSWG
jgi:hypothetical protein